MTAAFVGGPVHAGGQRYWSSYWAPPSSKGKAVQPGAWPGRNHEPCDRAYEKEHDHGWARRSASEIVHAALAGDVAKGLWKATQQLAGLRVYLLG